MSVKLTGRVIRLGLIKYGITKQMAANKLGLSVFTVRNQLNSKDPKLSTISKYAELFGISTSELISLSEFK